MLSVNDGTYSRAPCVAPWCVAVRCIGPFLARTHWSRWMNPIHKQVPLKMDIPLSYKRTRPWRARLGPVRIQHQNHTTSPCSLEKRGGKKKISYSTTNAQSQCVKSFHLWQMKNVLVVTSRQAQHSQMVLVTMRRFNIQMHWGVKRSLADWRFDSFWGKSVPPVQSKQCLLSVTRWLPQKNTEKALIWNSVFSFNLL